MISIITVAFNAGKELKNTLESVLSQQNRDGSRFTDFECIVVDGGSTDGSVDVLNAYRERFEAAGIHFDARSEKDNGIYDGMNKGITRASGDWMYFLNAGDVFYSEYVLCDMSLELEDAAEETAEPDSLQDSRPAKADVVYGDICSFIENGGTRREYIMKSGDDMETIRTNLPFCHQAAFISRRLHEKRPYSARYALAADYEFFLKAWLNGAKFRHVPIVTALFALDGASNRKRRQLFREYEQIRRENGIAKTGAAGAFAHVWGHFKITVADIMPKRLVYRIMEKRINSVSSADTDG